MSTAMTYVSAANMTAIAQYIKQNFALKSENTLTGITVNGTAVTPASGVAAITVPTKVSDLTNDSGFQANVIESVKVNGTALSISDKAVDITINASAEENQFAFSNIAVGDATIAADAKTDTLTIAAGSNITLTPDATNDTLTIAATDTTYNAAVAAGDGVTGSDGLLTAADKAKLDGIATGAEVNVIDTITVGGTTQTVSSKTVALGSAAGASTESVLTNGSNLPTGSAVQTYVTGLGYQTAADVSSAISAAVTSAYKAAGSLAANDLASTLLVGDNEGKVYNVTGSFTSTSDFVEGAGNTYPAGTNVVVIDAGSSTYKFDVLPGFVDLSGYQLPSDLTAMSAEDLAALWTDDENDGE